MKTLGFGSRGILVWGIGTVLLAVHGAAHGMAFTAGWQAAGKGGFSAPNAVCDASGKATAIVACEKGVGPVCFGIDGTRRWAHAMTPPVTAPPAVADLNGDGVEEIVAGDATGRIVALRAEDGQVLWTAQLPGGTAASSPAVVDIDEDGHPEVLVGDRSGSLYCLDCEGKPRWSFAGDGGQTGPVLVADVYDTPGKEIFMPSHDRCIYALSARGEWIWDLYFPADLFPNSPPVLADVDGDRVPELYIGGGLNHFYRIDLAKAAVAFEQNVYMHINGALTASDFDGDGKDEVAYGSKAGAAYLYGASGVRWTHAESPASFQCTPVAFPLGTEQRMAVLFLGIEGTAYAYDAAGNKLAEATGLPFKPEMSGPLVGDLDNDGQLELVVTSANTGDNAPGLFWYELGEPHRDDARNRLVFGQDRAHSGVAPCAARCKPIPVPPSGPREGQDRTTANPVSKARLLSGANTWRYDIGNPDRLRAAFLLDVRGPDGNTLHFVRHVGETKGRAVLTFPATTPGSYQVTRGMVNADRRTVLSVAVEPLSFDGIASDTEYLQGLFDHTGSVLAKWRETNAPRADGMLRQLTALRGTLAALAEKDTPDRVAQLTALRESAERLDTLASVGHVLAPTGSFVAWAFCPWAYFDPCATLPSAEGKTDTMELALGTDEYGSLALNLTNLNTRSVEVRALCDGLTQAGSQTKTPAAAHVALHRAVEVPTQNREQVADALPALDEAGTINIGGMETQQLWLTVNSVGLAPGEYTIALRVKSVEPDPTERAIPIRLTVHPLNPPRPRPLNLCNWVSYTGELASSNDAVLKDLVEHGETVLLAPAPAASCNETGQLTAPPDFTAHDQAVKRLSPHAFLLFLSPQGAVTGQPFLSEPWKKAFVALLREWAAHLDGLGIARDRWAVYPYDEPSSPYGETLRNLVAVAKLVREADPKIQIYTDPTSGSTMESIEMLKGLIDIWQPSDELLERLGPEMMPVIRSSGKQVWFYEAAGNSKTLSCLGKYTWRFWYTWKEGMTGVGWWVYATHGPDRWDGPNPVGDYWATVYDGPKGPVSSKRWEAAREGVQDYERLYALRAELQQAESGGVPAADLESAKQILERLPGEMESVLLHAGRRLPLTPDSVPFYEEVTRTLGDARRQITEARLHLKACPEQHAAAR